MAATRGLTVLMSSSLPASPGRLSGITMLGTRSQCRRLIYRCLCSVGGNVTTTNNIITKESTVDKSVAEVLEKDHIGKSGHINYKNHPGVMREKGTQLPNRLIKALTILLEKYPVKTLEPKVKKLVLYLQQRQPPVTSSELAEKTKSVENTILEKDGHKLENLSGEALEVALEKHKKKVINKLRHTIYNWKPVQYDAFTSYIYLIGRLASDYSVLLQNFTEISKRDADFKPTSIFHYGSKVGSGIWAANKIWTTTTEEHYCVEESGHLNTIAQLLLQDGSEQKMVSSIKGVHFRQFVPSSKERRFSMVVSAYMLMEMSSEADRQKIVTDLWEMTETYLVLVENGTGAGFSLINEAKEFILQKSKEFPKYVSPGHVFAPCAHDKACPKLRVKNQPCLTESFLRDVDFESAKLSEKPKKFARYSYVILKKGPRVKDTEWPRVLHPINAQRHVHIHACLPCGELQHVVISKGKFEKHLYNCAINVNQGDRIPVALSSQAMATSTGEIEASISDDSCSDTDDNPEKELDNLDINSGRK